MSTAKNLITLATIVLLVFAGFWLKRHFLDPEKTEVTSLAPTIEDIQTLSELVTNRVYVSDILKGSNKDYEGVWAINGDALITIDLAKSELINLDEKSKTATLILPLPKVTSPRVDHSRSNVGFIKGKGFAPLRNTASRAKMIDDAMEEGQNIIAQAASKPEIISNAKRQATLIIQNLYLKVGWKIKIQWKNENPSPL